MFILSLSSNAQGLVLNSRDFPPVSIKKARPHGVNDLSGLGIIQGVINLQVPSGRSDQAVFRHGFARSAPSLTGSRLNSAQEPVSDPATREVFIVGQRQVQNVAITSLRGELDGLHPTVLFDEIVGSHVSTANPNQNLIIQNLN